MAKRGKLTIDEIREIATERYEEGGDGIIECWTDRDIKEWLEEGNGRRELNKLIKLYGDSDRF